MARAFGPLLRATCLAALWLVAGASTAFGQLNSLQGLTGGSGAVAEKPVTASAVATINPDTREGTLRITAKIKPGWHIYSVTQKPGGPLKTKIKLDPKADAEFAGEPKAVTKPDSHPEPAFENLIVETHEDKAIWEVPIKLKAGVDAKSAKVIGAVNAQACADNCLPPTNYPFTAKAEIAELGEAKADARAESVASIPRSSDGIGEYQPANLHATLRGSIEPREAAPGSVAQLWIEATPAEGWHIYAIEDRPMSPIGGRPTLIVLTDSAGLRFLKPVESVPPVEKPSTDNAVPSRVHPSTVRWTVQLEVPPTTAKGTHEISGMIGLQTCKEAMTCDRPTAVRFRGTLTVGESGAGAVTSSPLEFEEAKYAEVARLAEANAPPVSENGSKSEPATTAEEAAPPFTIITPQGAEQTASLPAMILFGVLGGLILNLMPCVLPVIGLKILGFAQQAGHHRSRILMLNLWYAAGMLAVFLALATLAAGAKLGISEQNLGWGQQFSSTTFNVVMAALVFVMALSFLGVWEIPLPGFIGSGKAQKLASQEGAGGAFAKGIFTTLLATPCSGPFLGPVFGFTLTQSPLVIYIIFTAIGIGMALPYLLIGAFPSLIGWLPKPGAWMDTFKQIMAFVLLGTVAFIFSFMHKDYLVPTFVLLIGLWAACWWIGRTPTYEPARKQVSAWLQGGFIAAAIGLFAFTQLVPGKEKLPWQPFNRVELSRLNREGKTVLVDFSADWCLTCKLNLKVAINTQAVAEAVEENGIVPMLADWTDGSEEVTDMLNSLGSQSIPVLAIFPADRPGQVIVLRDTVTRKQVIEAIKMAGPSRDIPANLASADGNNVVSQ